MPTMELNINWSVFDTIQREMVEKAVANGHYEQLAAILYEVTPDQAVEIEKIQRQLRPREFKFESQAQQDFEKTLSNTPFNDITPEFVEEWQKKIDAEKEEKLQQLNGGVLQATDVKNQDGSQTTTALLSNDLKNIKGLGEVSIKRLNAANIYAVDELRKLDQTKRLEILGPLVAGKLKSLI